MSYQTIIPNKRIRGKNFTDSERDVVLEIIEKYKNVIENKKTDTESIRIKNAAWNQVTDEFNSVLPTNRTPSQLRVFYENHKVKLRRELVEKGVKFEGDDAVNKRMKFTESEEKLILRMQKPTSSSPIISYIPNNVEAGTSNIMAFRNEKDAYADNGQVYYADSNVSNESHNNYQQNFSHNSPINLDEDDDNSSEPLKIVTEIDPSDNKHYSEQETSQKSQETVKPSQAYAAIIESNKANYKLKMTKGKYADDYNRLKVELLHTELKLRNQEYEKISMSTAMEQKINTMRLKILECELEIKQEQLRKERERNNV